jgi:LemA protein
MRLFQGVARMANALRRQLSLVAVVLSAVLLSGCGINAIPTLEEQAKAGWSEVLNQYQRRADLVPNLVETVRAYAEQEREVLTAVVEARAQATQTQIALPPDVLTDPAALERFQQAQRQLGAALGRLIAITENYPELRSNQNFLALQSQLEGTENRIAVARRDYIEAVRLYNTELATFPGRIWATVLYSDKQPMATFTIAEEQMQVPEVDFGTEPTAQ